MGCSTPSLPKSPEIAANRRTPTGRLRDRIARKHGRSSLSATPPNVSSGAKGRRFKSCRARSNVPENASGFSERPAWTWLALVAAAPSPRRHSRRGCSPHDPAATRGRTMPVPSGTQRCTARATIDLLVARRRAADGRQRRPTSALALLRATCGRRTARSAGLTAWNSIR